MTVTLAIYTRTPTGIVEYHGTEQWASVAQFEAHACCLGPVQAEPEQMTGWHDLIVQWLPGTSCGGDTGYAVRS